LRMDRAGCEEKKGEGKGKLFHGDETCPAPIVLQVKNGKPDGGGKAALLFRLRL
jgi:hypothetical protein